MLHAFSIHGMSKVIGYGFFGQLLWMFGGLLLLIKAGKAKHIRNLAPSMAGSLSHLGLTGACTAEDLGPDAAARSPIMINIPFFSHLFVFTILAYSASKGALITLPAASVAILQGTHHNIRPTKTSQSGRTESPRSERTHTFLLRMAADGGIW